jgi:hypothetical protein
VLKTKVRRAISNLVTRPCARVHERTRVFGEAVRHEDGWGGSACVRTTVLQPAVARADSGGGLRWLKLMVEAACSGWS